MENLWERGEDESWKDVRILKGWKESCENESLKNYKKY